MFLGKFFASAKIKEICENQEGFTLNYHNKSAIKRLCFLLVWGRGNSNVTPICLRTKLDAPPLLHRLCTDFAPTLHRLWYGGRAKEERRKNGPESIGLLSLFEVLPFPINMIIFYLHKFIYDIVSFEK